MRCALPESARVVADNQNPVENGTFVRGNRKGSFVGELGAYRRILERSSPNMSPGSRNARACGSGSEVPRGPPRSLDALWVAEVEWGVVSQSRGAVVAEWRPRRVGELGEG